RSVDQMTVVVRRRRVYTARRIGELVRARLPRSGAGVAEARVDDADVDVLDRLELALEPVRLVAGAVRVHRLRLLQDRLAEAAGQTDAARAIRRRLAVLGVLLHAEGVHQAADELG